ncbi:integrase core domain-containing protein [Anoxynatronum buryatiense]|uniref:Integrase core domain-containing protein n=1 Tax=Anoxynatronum buryatiense TaxID=489973 RepID=A0AA45WW63_9CLOT|nr:integrase core domain-containing protein [Anoxynatronum buryatiense]SMP55430.1 Integrase core domain-containing protein [Anoxynatronum buryatiense]
MTDHLRTEGVLVAVQKAKQHRSTDSPTIIHSDRGCQDVSKAYLEATPAKSFIRSYSNKATPWDNAPIESFHALIKREWLNRYIIKNAAHAHELIFRYIETFYNTTRIHSHCEMNSPHDYEKQAKERFMPPKAS